MQRPFFSQSPNRVGSGPEGPPISRGAAGGASGAACARLSLEEGEFAGGLLRCGVDIPI